MKNKRNTPDRSSMLHHGMRAIMYGAALLLAFLSLAACNDSPTSNASSGWTASAHPFMAANGSSNIHNDAYMTDSYLIADPVDGNLTVTTKPMNRLCVSIAFDSQGAIRTLCTGADGGRAAH